MWRQIVVSALVLAGTGADPDLIAVAGLPAEALAACDARYRDATAKSVALKTVAAGRPCTVRQAPRSGSQSHFDDRSQTLHAPGDTNDVCKVIEGAVAAGLLPAKASARHGLAMLDVGAAFSGESILGHKLGFQVVAFEARKSEYSSIVAATQRFEHVEVVHAAVTDRSGPVTFNMAQDSSSLLKSAVEGEREAPKAQSEREQQVTVQGVTLDEIAAERGLRIGFIKIDVQGAEYNVLRGAVQILRRDKPVVNFEYCTPGRLTAATESPRVLAPMERLGYECGPSDPNMAACIAKQAMPPKPTCVTQPVMSRARHPVFDVLGAVSVAPTSCGLRNFPELAEGPKKGDDDKRLCSAMLSEHGNNVVVSIGSNNEFGFEEQMLQCAPSLHVATFDCTVQEATNKPRTPRVSFHPYCLSSKDAAQTRTWASIASIASEAAAANGNPGVRIAILKMDIEGWEWVALPQVLNVTGDRERILPRQIAVEVHLATHQRYDVPGFVNQGARAVLPRHQELLQELRRSMEAAGYALLDRNDNPWCGHCSELLFARVDSSITMAADSAATHRFSLVVATLFAIIVTACSFL